MRKPQPKKPNPKQPSGTSADAARPAQSSGAAKQKPDGRNNAAAQIQHRNETVYALANKSLTVARWSAVAGVLGVVIGMAGWVVRPEPQYFAATEDGRVIEMRPLSDPLQTENQITNWTSNAVTEAFTMDFVNFRDQLASKQSLFTQPGFNSFTEALANSGNLSSIEQNRYVVSATLNGTPRIVREGTSGDRYVWRIRVPVMIGYESAEQTRSQKRDAVVTVVRMPTTQKPEGVALHQIVMESPS